MNEVLENNLNWLSTQAPDVIRFTRGIEKEGLRVTPDNRLSQADHPAGLGSALTHPSITTDYSEALMEFITPTFDNTDASLEYLANLHRFAYLKLPENELIWPGSMPAIIDDELDIRIAEYGSSNIGRLKHVYRHGLWHRYGRTMQAIAGVHFNFSMSDEFWQQFKVHCQNTKLMQDFKSQKYFALIRHFRRYSWLLMLLFGASPAVDRSFLKNRTDRLQPLNQRTLVAPSATSLRMSDIGYTNNAQSNLYICFNSLPAYIMTLRSAIHTEYPDYARIGIKEGDEYLQMNTNILQIENEYYSDIRPKRVVHSGEKPVCALQHRGVEYIEVRCMDLDPFEPVGISRNTVAFLELFLTWCMLSESESISNEECDILKSNLGKIVLQGGNLDLELPTHNGSYNLYQQASHILDELSQLAATMDQVNNNTLYQSLVADAFEKINAPDLLPSSQLRARIQQGQEYHELMRELALQHKEQLLSTTIPTALSRELETIARESVERQLKMESEDIIPFEKFICDYQDQDANMC